MCCRESECDDSGLEFVCILHSKNPQLPCTPDVDQNNPRMSKMRSAIALSQLSFRDFAASTTGIALVSETG